MKETLSLKEHLEYTKTVNRGRSDPVWFLKEIIGFKSMWPMQEKIIRDFYQHKYDPKSQQYKKLIIKAGQRCQSRNTLILTREYGNIKIEDLYEVSL